MQSRYLMDSIHIIKRNTLMIYILFGLHSHPALCTFLVILSAAENVLALLNQVPCPGAPLEYSDHEYVFITSSGHRLRVCCGKEPCTLKYLKMD